MSCPLQIGFPQAYLLLPHQAAIRPHRHNLPRYELPAGLECAFRGIFNTAAAWNLHADNGDILDIIETDDFRHLFRVIHHIQLRASYQGDASGYKIIVEIAISKGSTVSGYQKTGILKIGGLDRSQFNLHRPLGQPALHGNGFSGKRVPVETVFSLASLAMLRDRLPGHPL